MPLAGVAAVCEEHSKRFYGIVWTIHLTWVLNVSHVGSVRVHISKFNMVVGSFLWVWQGSG
jgi:hypothetical protein